MTVDRRVLGWSWVDRRVVIRRDAITTALTTRRRRLNFVGRRVVVVVLSYDTRRVVGWS